MSFAELISVPGLNNLNRPWFSFTLGHTCSKSDSLTNSEGRKQKSVTLTEPAAFAITNLQGTYLNLLKRILGFINKDFVFT